MVYKRLVCNLIDNLVEENRNSSLLSGEDRSGTVCNNVLLYKALCSLCSNQKSQRMTIWYTEETKQVDSIQLTFPGYLL